MRCHKHKCRVLSSIKSRLTEQLPINDGYLGREREPYEAAHPTPSSAKQKALRLLTQGRAQVVSQNNLIKLLSDQLAVFKRKTVPTWKPSQGTGRGIDHSKSCGVARGIHTGAGFWYFLSEWLKHHRYPLCMVTITATLHFFFWLPLFFFIMNSNNVRLTTL